MSAKAQDKTKDKSTESASKGAKKSDAKETKNRTVTRSAKKEATRRQDKKKEDKNKKPNIFKRFVNYLHAVRVELKRVTWPTPREVRNSTITVLAALIFFGLLIYLVDTGIAPVLNAYSQLGA